jgi:2-iminoacetate synthase
MKTFYDEMLKTNEINVGRLTENINGDLVMRALEKDGMSFNDMLCLLSERALLHIDILASRAKEMTDTHFGKNINLYIPLYLSNECSNSCSYCGFNVNAVIPRNTLTIAEAEIEMKRIAATGMKNILLLTGEAPAKAGVGYMEHVIKIASLYFTQISLEVYPMDIPEYERLVKAGATGLVIYQETYDETLYAKLHETGPKKNFRYRLEAPERAAQAGFRFIGIGALLGLSEWRKEAALMFSHAKYLSKKYWRSDIALSFPRITPARGCKTEIAPVSETELRQMIFTARIYLEHAVINLSTRESAVFRDSMIGFGVTRLSAGSKTNPGGYEIHPEASGEQFMVNDTRTVEEVTLSISERGYYPVFKDWDISLNGKIK